MVEREKLHKGDCNKPRTIIFAGNGCIQHGWKVLESFLIDTEQDWQGYHEDPDLFLLKVAQDLRSCINNLETKGDVSPDDWKKHLRDRSEVAKAYENAKEIGVISKPDIIKNALKRDDTCVITSNWDKALWQDKDINNLCHIHGRCDISESLIFPTETFEESNHFLKLFKDSKKNHDVDLLKFLEKRVSALEEAENRVKKWLRSPNLEQIILWGIHLHTYDAEIISKIQDLRRNRSGDIDTYLQNNEFSRLSGLKRIFVVNPCKQAVRRVKSIFFEHLKYKDKDCKLYQVIYLEIIKEITIDDPT